MAIMIPEAIAKFDTDGEGRVYNYLKENLSDDYIVFYNLKSEITGLVDFIIVCPSGILGIEVKDWSAAYINSCNVNEVYLNDASNPVEEYPVKISQYRIWALVRRKIEKTPTLMSKLGSQKFPSRYSGVAWYVNLDDDELLEKLSYPKYRENGTIQQLTSEDFSKNAQDLIDSCFKAINYSTTRNLTVDECKEIEKFILQEKKIYVTFEDLVIELDKKQREYAKNMNYGQYILRGAGGTGKTVRLIGRAIYLAETHADYNIMFVTTKIPLANLIYPNLSSYSNITLHTKHDLLEKGFLERYNDGGSNFNVILIDELQDFSKEEIKLIKSLLSVPDQSHFIGAVDGAQNTYNNQYNLLDIAQKIEPLKQNYRNGDKILSYIQSIGQTASNKDENSSNHYNYYAQTISPHVDKGEVYTIDLTYIPGLLNPNLFHHILLIISFYCEVSYRDMAIINIGYNGLLDGLSEFLTNYQIPNERGFSTRESIKLLNNNETKGLEFKFVILIINDIITDCEQSKILAASRASQSLYVIYY